KELLENKNIFGVEEFLSDKEISEDLKEIFVHLPAFFGGLEQLGQVKGKVKSVSTKAAIERLEKVYEILEIYGLSDYVTLDPGLMNHYHYYTGIVFKVYTYGTGEAIATGGRYDNLIGQFGKEASAVGVVILLDQLMTALSGQGIPSHAMQQDTIILYHSQNRKLAVRLGTQYRGEGLIVRLMRKSREHDIEKYVKYAKESNVGGILYIESGESVHIIDCKDGTTTSRTINEILAGEGESQ
ncbi:MAG: ATP phosphoribosyltransferase regulatory subunit, partial [Lachnoclostridium sp.]|nr:ATP phosphoribosyltransferase regulatory subunit [Lachnoclostridium sp.]